MLDIDIESVESKPVVNLAKSLEKRFRPNSSNDISDAVILSCYLYFLGMPEESIRLLNSFLYFSYLDKPESHRHLWVDNCQGILLLEYINRLKGQESPSVSLAYILGPEATVNPIKFMKSELKYFLRENSKVIKYAETESPKYKCDVFAQQVLKCIELIVLWGEFSRSGAVRLGLKVVTLEHIQGIFNELVGCLVMAMAPANQAKQSGTR